MRVLIAPAAFGDRLGAVQVGAAMAEGWAETAPGDLVDVVPMSDGGPGFGEAVLAATGGEVLPCTVRGPTGDPVPAAVVLASGTAYVAAAEACGRHLLPPERRDPGRTTSYGVGQLIQAAVDAGARRVVVGVGGTATNDAGAGLLAALGGGPEAGLDRGGLALSGISAEDVSGLAGLRARLAGVELVLAAARDLPLLGFHGTSATYAEAKGASPDQAQALESALGHFAHLAARSLVSARPLAGFGPAAQPGAGAGGGIGFALLLLGATYAPGVEVVAQAAGLAERIKRADLGITAEETFDWQSLTGGVVAGVAAAGLDCGVPVVVVAGQVLVGRRESMTLGLSGAYPVTERPEDVESALADPVQALQRRTARVARTWSRR
ncbi:MAG: glycerate kinase [Actinomycetales bacterium]